MTDWTKSLPGPDNILRKEFPNGMTVLIRENPLSQAAAIAGLIPCGSYLDPHEKIGVANFTAGCLMTGTTEHDFGQIHGMLENSGASLSYHSNTGNLIISGNCLREDLPTMLRLIQETLDRPVFPEMYFENQHRRVLTAYEILQQDPESRTDERFDWLLYGDTPYGRPEYGTPEITNRITREDLAEFHRDYYGPKGMILVISGGIRAEEALDECGKIFGSWNKAQQTVDRASYYPQVPPPQMAIREHIEIPEKSEMALVIGTMGPKTGDPDHTAAVLGNNIFGEFGMMGRIGRLVREENGLAYHVSSSLDSMRYGGAWSVDAGVNPENVDKAAELIYSELRRFTSEKVSAEELDDVQSFAIGSLPFSIESNAGVASVILRMESQQVGLDYLLRTPDRIRAVTTDQILETARKWLDPDRMIQLTAGTSIK